MVILKKIGENVYKIIRKGSMCSVNGKKYEQVVHSVVKRCHLNDSSEPFNKQGVHELAGSSSKIDILCGDNIGIEVKKYNAPDWSQCCIKHNQVTGEWSGSNDIFNKLLTKKRLFNGESPPFESCNMTHKEWLEIKNSTDKWNDEYIDIPPDTIRRVYQKKGCHYIQISGGYGLYHLGVDICGFGVPIFEIDQRFRIRTKIHTRKDKNGFCRLSVTTACQPKNIKNFAKSPYSLDDKDRLPLNLTYF